MNSINSETNQEKIHTFRDDYLIDQELGDHNYIEKIFKFNGYNFQLISLNIPQKNAFRSMTIFNKNQNFLRTKFNLKNDNEAFKEKVMGNIMKAISENLNYIKTNYPDKNQVLQGSGKIPVTNYEIFKEHFNEEFELYPDTQIFLRVATHGKDKKLYSQLTYEEIENLKIKNEDKDNMIIFKQRFPDDYYLDLVFSEESKIDYQTRFNTIIGKIFELRIPNFYFILCLQEINPVCDVIDCNNPMLGDLQLISVIKPKPHDSFIIEPHDPFIEKKIEKGNYEIKINFNSYIKFKSNSLLFVSNNFVEDEQMSINIINIDESGKNSNEIINLFNDKKSTGQNLCYEFNVDGKKLDLYNLHTTLIRNQDSLEKFKEIISKINENFIIVGDMNLEADKIQKYRLSKLFRDNFIYSYFLNTPEIAYGLEGYDTNLNTNDVFISRGIELLN